MLARYVMLALGGCFELEGEHIDWPTVIVFGIIYLMFYGMFVSDSRLAVAKVNAWWRRSTPERRRRDAIVWLARMVGIYVLWVAFQLVVVDREPITGHNLANECATVARYMLTIGALYLLFALLWHFAWYRSVLPLARRYALWRHGGHGRHVGNGGVS